MCQFTCVKIYFCLLLANKSEGWVCLLLAKRLRTTDLKVCTFARFKENCEVMLLRSFKNFKLMLSHHRKELCGDPKSEEP